MIDLLCIENKEKLSIEYTGLIENLLGEDQRNSAARYRKWQDRQAYLLGKLLVAFLLSKHGYNSQLLKTLSYTETKRPYIKEVKGDFNISHSGKWVICAFSGSQVVGVDIEQIKDIELKDFDYVLNEMDKAAIASSVDQPLSFFRVWSAKEAILKANGCGLVDEVDKIELGEKKGVFDKQTYYLQELTIDPQYASYIASSRPIDIVNIKKVTVGHALDVL